MNRAFDKRLVMRNNQYGLIVYLMDKVDNLEMSFGATAPRKNEGKCSQLERGFLRFNPVEAMPMRSASAS